MIRYTCIAPLAAVLLSMAATSAADINDRVPNLIFILADDLGYGDLGCYGQARIKTPMLDQMASEGMRFTDFYAGSTVCAPSRCVLMTGYHTGHCLIRGNRLVNLRPEDVTMAELLSQAGYATCLSGKWGLGEEGSAGVPTRQGFDEFYGYLSQRHAHNYYPTFLMHNQERVPQFNKVPNEGAVGQGKASEKLLYSHDMIMHHAMDFVCANHTKPFFLYLALTIPHANNEAGREGMEVPELGDYEGLAWPEPQKAHAAMISRMDRDCGRLLQLLRDLKIADNTLVVFSSDNGPHAEGGNRPEFNRSSGNLKGIKRSLNEGGIRVPAIAWWPGTIKPNSTSGHVAGFQDIMPTFTELAKVSDRCPTDIDGISFLATLRGGSNSATPVIQRQHELLYWAFYEGGCGQAARSGDWKVIQQPITSKPRLYNLPNDMEEEFDLSAARPDVLQQMMEQMAQNYVESNEWQFPRTDSPQR